MALYSSRAFGIELDRRMVNVDLSQVKTNFVVSPGGVGNTIDPMIGQNIDRANSLAVPFFMTWQIDPAPYLPIAQNSYPEPKDDYHIKVIDRAVYIGGAANGIKRKISGIILDIRNNKVGTTTITEGNHRNMALYLFNSVWSRYKIPVYIMASQALLSSYSNGAPGLSQFLSTCDGICSWKSANPGANTTMASWSSFPIPGDTYAVEYVANAKLVYLAKYAATVFNFPGITDAQGQPVTTGLWMYKSLPSDLVKDVNYTGPVISSTTTPSTPPTTTPITPTPTTSPTITDLYALVQQLQTQMTTMQAAVNDIRTHFN
jgi:hypothetical protein